MTLRATTKNGCVSYRSSAACHTYHIDLTIHPRANRLRLPATYRFGGVPPRRGGCVWMADALGVKRIGSRRRPCANAKAWSERRRGWIDVSPERLFRQSTRRARAGCWPAPGTAILPNVNAEKRRFWRPGLTSLPVAGSDCAIEHPLNIARGHSSALR